MTSTFEPVDRSTRNRSSAPFESDCPATRLVARVEHSSQRPSADSALGNELSPGNAPATLRIGAVTVAVDWSLATTSSRLFVSVTPGIALVAVVRQATWRPSGVMTGNEASPFAVTFAVLAACVTSVVAFATASNTKQSSTPFASVTPATRSVASLQNSR